MNPSCHSEPAAVERPPPELGEPTFVEVVRTPEDLARTAEPWDCLAAALPMALPMASHAWVSSTLERPTNRSGPWLCLAARTGPRLSGVLPVLLDSSGLPGLRRTVARTPFDWHTISSDLLLAPGVESTVAGQLLERLTAEVTGLHALHLRRVPAGSAALACLTQSGSRWTAIHEPDGNAAFVPIAGDYPTYLKGLRESFARNLRRWQKKVGQLPGVEFHSVSANEATAEHLDRFVEMESAGWKGREGSAIGASDELIQFYRTLTARLASRGWLEWNFLRTSDGLLAGQLAARIGRRLVLLKIAFREDYAPYAPGNVLLARTLERAFQCGQIDEVNCLTDYLWTRNWQMQLRPYYSVYVYPRRWSASLFGAMPRRLKLAVKNDPRLGRLYRAASDWWNARSGDKRPPQASGESES
jgi:CelD/BcsL family acetyltransferase involved in cellulose biosynthesis